MNVSHVKSTLLRRALQANGVLQFYGIRKLQQERAG